MRIPDYPMVEELNDSDEMILAQEAGTKKMSIEQLKDHMNETGVGITIPVTVEQGGTGAITADTATDNLGIKDKIIADGDSGIWHWVKYASGWAECWGRDSFKSNNGRITLQYATGYTSYTKTFRLDSPEFPMTINLEDIHTCNVNINHIAGLSTFLLNANLFNHPQKIDITFDANYKSNTETLITQSLDTFLSYYLCFRWK